MKKAFFIVLFVGLIFQSYAQDMSALYSAASGSVVYLQHQIFLDSADCSKPELWKRLEKLTKRAILDAAWPLASGSGFFIDDDGAILTNRHVVKIGGLESVRRDTIRSVGQSLDKGFSSNFSTDELGILKKDFETMISKGRYSFNAMLGMKDLGAVTILATADDEETDLAIVKASGGPFQGIKLAASASIGPELVGTEVLSFGYPLGSQLDTMFQERTVTMNKGTISAFRKTELSLQHSAAISHGNSGGPLLNSEGLVLGINTAGLQEQEGNSLFYAIDVGRANEFLGKMGFGNILLWNQRLPGIKAASSNLKLNALGEIECSADVILDIDKEVDVFLDGVKVGTGPQYLHLVNPVSSLELHSPTSDFSAKLRLLSSLSGSSTLRPPMTPQKSPVKINSDPSGATVIADGKTLGVTPLNLTLVPGRYAVQLRQEGQWYEEAAIEVQAGTTDEHVFRSQTAYPITFKELPTGAGITLRLESKLRKAVFQVGEKVFLPTDEWSLRIDGSDVFTDVTVPIAVKQAPLEVDLAPYIKKGSLRIVGLDPNALIWIDDKPFPNLAADTIQMTLGIHTVYVWENGLQPLEKIKITVRNDDKSFVTWDRIRGHDFDSTIYGWSGVGTGALGSLLLALGLYGSQNSVAMSMTSSYQEYLSFRNTATVGIWSGAALLVGTAVIELIALNEKNKYEAQRKYMKSLEGKQ